MQIAVKEQDKTKLRETMREFCAAMMEIENGKIVRQTAVQAWDG
jgi:hypothetical protein